METWTAFVLWSLFWALILVYPPGSKEIITSLRLNFLHGFLSSLVAITCLLGFLPENVTSTATISYFIVDFINILLNDFYFHAKCYQPPNARRIEYFHHCFCCFVAVMCEFYYKDYCPTYSKNPFIKLMFAEFSTPFLIAWRHTKMDIFGILFGVTFFIFRIVYHGVILIPDFYHNCHPSVTFGFGVPYNLLNLYFFYMIVRKVFKPEQKKNE